MRAKRIIYNGNENTGVDYIPYIGGMPQYAYVGGVRIPHWTAITRQPSPKITAQPTGSTGINGGYVSGNYRIYCSTTNNPNSYGAWRAFNGTNTDIYGWASGGESAGAWIGILLPVPVKSAVVSIYNRISPSIVYGPNAVSVYGSDAVTLSGALIGTGTGNGNTSGGLITVVCNNHNDSYRFFRIVATATAQTAFVAIGQIYIDGKQAT